MKTIWQVRRAALARALGIITSALRSRPHKEPARSFGFQRWRSIGILALVASATLVLSLGAARAVGTGATTINVQSSQNPSGAGQSVTFTIAVNGVGTNIIPTGTITLVENGSKAPTGPARSGRPDDKLRAAPTHANECFTARASLRSAHPTNFDSRLRGNVRKTVPQ